ncbi:MAG: response regulator [Gammaproteobacteria bacterium]
MSHLLLVEDDRVIGSSLKTIFEDSGYQVTWLQHGELAQQILQASSFDLIILDLGLPQVSGLEILQKFAY